MWSYVIQTTPAEDGLQRGWLDGDPHSSLPGEPDAKRIVRERAALDDSESQENHLSPLVTVQPQRLFPL
jgi:hypothetical protein